MKALVVAFALMFCVQLSHAIDTAPAFEDPVQQTRYNELIRELRCLQCRNYSIADSDVSLAADMRRQVRELMAEGKSDDEIKKYMTDRFGQYVLYNPPVTRQTLLLWAAPLLFVLIGVTAAAVVIVRKSRLPDTDPSGPDSGVP